MTATYQTRPPIPPVVCAPWCAYGDGHPNEWCPEDQTCWGNATYVALSQEKAGVDQRGDPYPSRVGAMARRGYNKAPVVNLHAELCEWNLDTEAQLTADEARALAAALIAAADLIEGNPTAPHRISSMINLFDLGPPSEPSTGGGPNDLEPDVWQDDRPLP